MANSFSVEKSIQGEVVVLEPKGFLDAHTAPEFEAAIQAQLDEGRNRIIVDCSGLTYISSAGLGVFMGFVEDVREGGGDIKMCALIPKVRQVFELLGFHQLFHIEETLPEAVDRFEKAPVWEG